MKSAVLFSRRVVSVRFKPFFFKLLFHRNGPQSHLSCTHKFPSHPIVNSSELLLDMSRSHVEDPQVVRGVGLGVRPVCCAMRCCARHFSSVGYWRLGRCGVGKGLRSVVTNYSVFETACVTLLGPFLHVGPWLSF
jgi:hypothetical protein